MYYKSFDLFSNNRLFITIVFNLDSLLLGVLEEEVESVGVHDGDDNQAREAENH